MQVAFATLISLNLFAQDSGFIYGKVTTEDGDVYEGPIRWGKEEVYWTDMFNASKEENKNLDYLSNKELDYLEDRRRYSDGIFRIVDAWDWDEDFVHEFSCEFGNLKAIRLRGRNDAEIELRNGDYLEIDGSGYNDIGARLRILDQELGLVKLDWNRIEEVEFLDTPRNLGEKFGEPLYGTVESELGKFTGFVQWDHDERVDTDVLDGDTRDGDMSIPFGKIKSIERSGYSRSIVTLKSGREFELKGSNDVNDDNKGIIVTVEGLGRVDLEWEDFEKVTFTDPPSSGPNYASFSSPEKIKARVEVDNGDAHEGEIIYDLDEEYTFEVLNGRDDDTKFIIPFRNLKSITPKGDDRTVVELKSGDRILLEDSQDVSDKHQGLLIRTKSDRIYVPWDRVETIEIL